MQTLKQRLADSENRCDLLSKLNENLAEDLSSVLDELDALKRTVIKSHSLVTMTQLEERQNKSETLMVPSFLRVMEAE